MTVTTSKAGGITTKGLYLEEDVPEIRKLQKELRTEDITSARKQEIKATINELEKESIQRLSRNKKYYSSVEHFTKRQVDDLIPVWQESLRNREREYEIRSGITNFIDLYGLEFISLDDEKLKKVNNKCKSVYKIGFEEECLSDYDKYTFGADDIVKTFNSLSEDEVGDGIKGYVRRAWDETVENFSRGDYFEKDHLVDAYKDYKEGYSITKEDLKQVVLSGKMSREIAHGFCGLFTRQLVLGSSKKALRPGLNLKDVIFNRNSQLKDVLGEMLTPDEKQKEINKLKKACFSHEGDKEKPSFIVDRKIRIHSLEGERPVFRGGKQMNVNVGAAHSFHRDERFAFARGFNLAATGRFFTQFISDVTGLLKMGVDYTDAKSKAVNTTIQKATFLVMQSAAFDIKLKDYEHCAVIRWNPEIFNGQNWYTKFAGIYNNEGRMIYIPGGYFLCAGKDEEIKPVYVREHYYYFTQHFTDGDMLDSGDLYNHPWLLSLRGSRDGASFVSRLAKEDYNIADLSKASHDDEMWPIKRMIEVYLHVLPSFPGMYSWIDQYGEDYPWNELPEESYKRIQEETLETNFGRTALGLPDFSQMERFVEEQEDIYIQNRKAEGRGRFFEQFGKGSNPPLGR